MKIGADDAPTLQHQNIKNSKLREYCSHHSSRSQGDGRSTTIFQKLKKCLSPM